MPISPLNKILESVAKIVPADLAAILAMTPDRKLRVLASAGALATPKLRELSIDLNQRPALRAALEKSQPTVMHSEPGEEIGEPDTYEGAVSLPGDHSCLVAPLRHENELEGLLTVDVAVCRAFEPQQVAAIGALADVAARLIHEEQRADALSKDLDQLAIWRAGLKEDGDTGASLIGSSPAWLRVVERARLAAPTNATVLITGETGTGKEQVARAIHQWSLRAGGPFVALNCSAVVPELASSELFGHERGAFTGADRRREGRFALAEKGTLFLDEVADLPPGVQAQLLRVIQERVYERVGGAGTLRRADVRLIAATHKDLWQEVAEGRFREDLYFRLSTYPLHLPPLRERVGDIPLLASHLLKRIGKELGIPVPAISPAAIRLLEGRQWPGNVRELRNALERAAILAQGQTIQPKHFDFPGEDGRLARGKSGSARADDPDIPSGLNRLDTAIAAEVLRALREAGGKVAGPGGAAERLGVPPTTLHSLMKRLGLKRPREFRRAVPQA
ncbi:MAG TPA: sigma 54-interacting transcriptional regulator [Bryobacteraceae bacterium]|nr:sigma 54-interacting transcriptional regulator [Bryobacteraceae bacterium]